MRTRYTSLLLVSALWATGPTANAQSLQLSYPPTAEPSPPIKTVIMSNGGSWTYHYDVAGLVTHLVRYDANGQPVLAKDLSLSDPDTNVPYGVAGVELNDGNLLLIFPSNHLGEGDFGPATNFVAATLVCLDQDANVLWSKVYHETSGYMMPRVAGAPMEIHQGADGRLLFNLPTYSDGRRFHLRLNNTELEQWHDLSGDGDWYEQLVPDDLGGYWTSGTQSIAHVDASGTVSWAKRLNFAGYEAQCGALMRTADGRLRMVGPHEAFGQPNLGMIEWNTDGTFAGEWVTGPVVSSPWAPYAFQATTFADGTMHASSYNGYDITIGADHAFVSGWLQQPALVGMAEVAIGEQRIVKSGMVNYFDPFMGVNAYARVFWDHGADMSDMCLVSPLTCTTQEYPAGLITVEDISATANAYGFAETPITATTTAVALPAAADDFCTTLAPIIASVAERPVVAPVRLMSNALAAGDELRLQNEGPVQCMVLNAQGAELLRTNVLSSAAFIPTRGLAPGTYWLRVADPTGKPIAHLPFVLL